MSVMDRAGLISDWVEHMGGCGVSFVGTTANVDEQPSCIRTSWMEETFRRSDSVRMYKSIN